MRLMYTFASFIFLAASPLFSETVENVEYHLPEEAKDWEIGAKLEDEAGTTTIYLPKSTPKESATEFFAVVTSNQTFNPKDSKPIEESFKQKFQGKNVTFTVLGKDDHSVFFEWVVKEQDQEKIHAWSRAFATANGAILLEYVRGKLSDDEAEKKWLKALQEAHINQSQ